MFSCELYAGPHRLGLGQGQLQVPAQLRGQRDQGGSLLPESSTQQGLTSLWPRGQPIMWNILEAVSVPWERDLYYQGPGRDDQLQ